MRQFLIQSEVCQFSDWKIHVVRKDMQNKKKGSWETTGMLLIAGFSSDHVFHISPALGLLYRSFLETAIPLKTPSPFSHASL